MTTIDRQWPRLANPRNRETLRAAPLDELAAAIGYVAAARKGSTPAWVGRVLVGSGMARTFDLQTGPLDGLAIVRLSLTSSRPTAYDCTVTAETSAGSDSVSWQVSFGRQQVDLLVELGDGSEVEPASRELVIQVIPTSSGLALTGLAVVRLPLVPPWGAAEV